MTSSDAYGNVYWPTLGVGTLPTTTLPINITTTGNTGNTINVPSWMTTASTLQWPYAYYEPDSATLTDQVVETLFEKMVTTVKPGEKVVVCMDKDITDTQCRDMADRLTEAGLEGIVVRGARAGTGFEGHSQKYTEEEQRVDILARIGELWAQCPHIKLTSLLEWWEGQEMDDADFAKAVEVYFQKVTNTNGIYGGPQ